MRFDPPRLIACALLGICLASLYGCFSLSFAGGWVGRYARLLETAGLISVIGVVFFGFLGLWLFRDIFFKR
jgi:hypothetical protein